VFNTVSIMQALSRRQAKNQFSASSVNSHADSRRLLGLCVAGAGHKDDAMIVHNFLQAYGQKFSVHKEFSVQCEFPVCMYVDGRIRKDIDNPGATWEPCRTLTVSMSHEESSRPEPSSRHPKNLHASARGRNKVATAFQYRTWSP
jgi:predicted TIM-barrel enzyme